MFELILDENEEPDFKAMGEPTTSDIFAYFESINQYVDVHSPGIHNVNHVVVSDWNYVPDWVSDYFEYYNYDIDWDDTSDFCQVCLCHIHTDTYTEPDWTTDEYAHIYCKDCVLESPEEFIEDYVFYSDSLPVYPKAVPSWLVPDLHKCGLVPLYSCHSACRDKFESGLYEGMNDTPEKVAKLVTEELGPTEMVFCIESCNPFMVSFSAHVRKKDDV